MEIVVKFTPENFSDWQNRGFAKVPLKEENPMGLVEVRLKATEINSIERTETDLIYHSRFFRRPGPDKGDGLWVLGNAS